MAVISVSSDTIKQMQHHYQAYLKENKPPYSVFAATISGTTITAYASGKVVFQGHNADQECLQWEAVSTPATKKKSSSHLPNGFEKWSVIGSDEVGNGSYFGPLVVCSAYVDKTQLPALKQLGVQDSKALTDQKILQLADTLTTCLPHRILNVLPEKYNAVQPTMSQGQMKAELHNHALGLLLKDIAPVEPDGILIDQFELPQTYWRHIRHKAHQVKNNVYFITKGESHHLAVAAASIIARATFLNTLEQMSQDIGVTIPSGAGANVDQVAKSILHQFGEDTLKRYVKWHFANTDKIK